MPAQFSEKAKAQIMAGTAAFLDSRKMTAKFDAISFSKSGDVFHIGFRFGGVEVAFQDVVGARLDLGDVIVVDQVHFSMGIEVQN